MGDKDEGNAYFLLDVFQFPLHFLAQLQIQCTQRLIQQQYLGFIDQCTGNSNTLLLTAGHLIDPALFKAPQTDQTQHTLDLLFNDILWFLFQIQAKGNVVIDIEVGEQGIFLEYGVDLTLIGGQTGNILSVKQYLTVICIKKSGNDTQQSSFAAAGGTQQGDKFIFINIQRNALEHPLTVKILDDVFQFDEFLHFPLLMNFFVISEQRRGTYP